MEDSLKRKQSVLFSRFLVCSQTLEISRTWQSCKKKAQGGVGEDWRETEDLMVLFTGLYLLPKTGWEEYLLKIPFSLFYLTHTVLGKPSKATATK